MVFPAFVCYNEKGRSPVNEYRGAPFAKERIVCMK